MLISQRTEAVLDDRVGMDDAFPSARPMAAIQSAHSAINLSVADDLASVADEWGEFETTADCTAFQSFAWHAAWQKCVGALTGVIPAIVVGRKCDRIIFIMPLAVERGKLASRLVWHGSDLCDYNAPLLAPDFSAVVAAPGAFVAVWQDVVARLQADSRFRHDVVVFTKMPETVGAQANPFVALPTTLNPSGAYARRSPRTGTRSTRQSARPRRAGVSVPSASASPSSARFAS